MPRTLPLLCILVLLAVYLLAGCTKEAPQKTETSQNAKGVQIAPEMPDIPQSGEALFKRYCSSCHPDGGNVSDPDRPLYGSALKRKHITKPEDVVRIMRNPLSRMIRFDVSTLSDKDAGAIAEYILTAFR